MDTCHRLAIPPPPVIYGAREVAHSSLRFLCRSSGARVPQRTRIYVLDLGGRNKSDISLNARVVLTSRHPGGPRDTYELPTTKRL